MGFEAVLKEAGFGVFARTLAPPTVPARAVAMSSKVAKVFNGLPKDIQAQLLVTARSWCAGRPLPDSKHKKNEGRKSVEGIKLLRQAFAAPSVRLYGWVEAVAGVEVFNLVDADANKKQQRADQDLLAEVSRKATAAHLRLAAIRGKGN